jgi:hypothetical protein
MSDLETVRTWRGRTLFDRDILVPYDRQLVKDAPRTDVDQQLSQAEEQQLWQHYGLDYDTPGDDEASSEELRVGTSQRGRVRLRKYVTAEQ